MPELSILIPSRNEEFLAKTIENLLENIEADTEIIAVLDGAWSVNPIPQHPKVTVIYNHESIGQRGATNQACKLSKAKYVMKLDAHCAVDKGFDKKLIADMQDDWTVLPLMKNLHAFDWVCPDGHRRYQSPSGVCNQCGKETHKEIIWQGKASPNSTSYCFDPTPHFQYFNEFKKRPEGQGELTETMSIQGSCFMLTRQKYWELNICDEKMGSWGSQGIEVACKTWLSGGKVICNQKTWYAHMFRTQGGDFGFPYPISGRQVQTAKAKAKDLFFANKWDKQIHPLSWLVEKFWPVNGWTDADLEALKLSQTTTETVIEEVKPIASSSDIKPTRGVIYYTDSLIDEAIAQPVRDQLQKAVGELPIVSVSLKPLDFGKNITLDLQRGYLTMFKQILAGLEALDTDIVYFAEHDILYHPSHFDFIPSDKQTYYYNMNVWQVRVEDGHALYYDCKKLSQLCAYRQLLIEHYKQRVAKTEAMMAEIGHDEHKFHTFIRSMGFEPGTHNRADRVDDFKADSYRSEFANIDIRHTTNLTTSRWSQEQFKNLKSCQNWLEAEGVAGWGVTKNNFNNILASI